MTTRFRPTHDLVTICPYCKEQHDAITATPGADRFYPEDGDVTICFKCGSVAIFNKHRKGGMRKPNRTEQKQFDESEQIQKLTAAWRTAIGVKNGQA